MSRSVVNILLSVLALVLIFLIVKSVIDPIKKQAEIERVEALVKSKLEEIKTAQFTYKEINDTFAGTFSDLIQGLKDGKVPVLKKLGGKAADTLSQIEVDTSYVNALEHAFGDQNYPIDLIGKVPPANEYDFIMKTRIIESKGLKLPVLMIKDPQPINPKDTLILGSLEDAVFTGNWK